MNLKQDLKELKQKNGENLKLKLLKQQENRLAQITDIEKVLKKIGFDDRFTFTKLKEQIFEARTSDPLGNEIPDFQAMLDGIKIWKRLKGYNKKGISLEELLGIDGFNNTAKLHILLDEIGLDDESVLSQLKYIIENAFVVIPIAGGDAKIMPYNKVINAAIKEYALLKDYIEDDSLNALNLLKVDNHIYQQIFGGE